MRNSLLFFLLLVFIQISYAQTIYEQSAYVWDLSEIYSTDDEWYAEYEKASKQIERVDFEGLETFTSSKALSHTLQSISSLRTWVSKLSYYAILRWEEGAVEDADAFLERGELLLSSFEALLSDLEGIIHSVEKQTLQSWLLKDPALFVHRHWLNLVLDQKDSRIHPEAEQALRKTQTWISGSIDTYWELQGLERLWPMFQNEVGKTIRLGRSNFRKIRTSESVAFRNAAANVYYQNLEELSQLYGNLYTRKIKSELELAKLRGFADGIDANWFFYGGVPKGGYQVCIEAARANVKTLQRYAKLRAKVLQEDSLHYLDFFRSPKAMHSVEYSFKGTMEIALEASRKVNRRFHENMKTVVNNRHWLHLADTPKNAQYHIRPPVSGIHPFLILKYQPKRIQSRALVGGLFQMAASVSSMGVKTTDIFESEAPVHISGVIYAGDLLFDQALVEQTKNKEGKMAGLLESLEFLRRFYRNVILLELDAAVQARIAEGEIVSGTEISEIYLKLLRAYYGHEQGITRIPEYLQHDWMMVTPLLYMPKYEHHFWAPSLAVGAALIDEKAGDSMAKRFLPDFTEDRLDSYSTLREASFDLMDPNSYVFVIQKMNQLMDQLESLLAEH